jgi:hypothetical protein
MEDEGLICGKNYSKHNVTEDFDPVKRINRE